jgi:hypothetical protein
MTDFAEVPVSYPDGQNNVETPPDSLLDNGFIPKQNGVRGQPIPAQWLNWLFREAFRQVNVDRVKDGNGVNAFDSSAEGVVTLYAVVKADTTKFIHAVGYKTAGNAPVFKTIDNGTLTLGAITATSVIISGALASTIALRVSIRGA